MLSLITGVGARGQVGFAVAQAMAARGDTVLLVARDAADAANRAAELAAEGGVAHGYACDLASEAEVERLAKRVTDEHGGRLDALVNVAGGFALSGPLDKSDPAVVDRLFTINFRTAYLATRAFVTQLRSAGGSAVFFASDAVLEGSATKGIAAYVAAKSAVVALMRSVADENASSGVRSNALAPGAIRTATNLETMGVEARYVEREDVASAVLFLCSEDARAVTGQVIRLGAISR